MTPYEPKKIERKWQKIWEEERAFEFKEKSSSPKFYILDMFPYPSSEGLHVGHPEGYTATDIVARYQRMRGWNVLHPMGWDAFGLPAENYAIRTGAHPAETTEKSINRFRSQIKSLGLSYDWSREVNTSDPDYYRWTQWLFLYLYKRGLAYRAKAPVNWCPGCQTVLANEQVAAGECERCGSKVIQKKLSQWFFKITDYADQLLAGLEELDWPERIKAMQRNWIGRSEGARIRFELVNVPGQKDGSHSVEVFTTRPDTTFGATFLVVSPEVARQWIDVGWQAGEEVAAYIEESLHRTELERLGRTEKTGVYAGIDAVNPANRKQIPVWIADYVLGSYGTGAIMAVPAHDARDFEFAKNHDLKIVRVIDGGDLPYIGEGKLIHSDEFDGVLSNEARDKITEFVGGKKETRYKLRDWLISRQRYWGAPIPIIYCEKCGTVPVPEKDLPVILPADVSFKPTGVSPLRESEAFLAVKCPKCAGPAQREADTMDTFVDSSWYFLRYIDPKNKKNPFDKKKAQNIMPVDVYVGGAEHAVLHLLYSRFVVKALADGEWLPYNEPFLKLRNQGLILGPDGQKMSKSRGNVVNPDDVVADYGADAFRMYEMFMGPFQDAKPWDTRSIVGIFRFLVRVWNFGRDAQKWPKEEKVDESPELRRLTHETIGKVEKDIVEFSFNTAVSALMILFADIEREKSLPAFRTFLLLLYPFAPHLASEIWSALGFGKYIHNEPWPEVIKEYLMVGETQIVIQVNGKLRDTVLLPVGMTEEELKEAAISSANVQKHLAGKNIKKIIVVPGRIVNIVAD